MTIDKKEKMIHFSDGYWIPMEYLLPNSVDGMKEWERLYMRSFFTYRMFKEAVAAVGEAFDVKMFDVVHQSGTWQVYKNIRSGCIDYKLELYLNLRKK